jgi:hypothetical protein
MLGQPRYVETFTKLGTLGPLGRARPPLGTKPRWPGAAHQPACETAPYQWQGRRTGYRG